MVGQSKANLHYAKDVFINCPFDDEYASLLRAAVFTVILCKCRPRCALEKNNGGEVRFEKIIRIIQGCRLGIHDLSRVETNAANLPRFNMPLELGLFLGAMRMGSKTQSDKSCLILERDRFSYQQFVSDLAGQDIKAHNNDDSVLIRHIRDWLRTETDDATILSSTWISLLYGVFQLDMKDSGRGNLLEGEINFADFLHSASKWWENNETFWVDRALQIGT